MDVLWMQRSDCVRPRGFGLRPFFGALVPLLERAIPAPTRFSRLVSVSSRISILVVAAWASLRTFEGEVSESSFEYDTLKVSSTRTATLGFT
eukprot:CAMPEP_0119151926 /NCGR_PEP_ID=MMETSP1310-20130426/47027_1 /TAXON_ID=464262 /ORGANISM="Genus nov. species nov., Strain RCC2339" /LENGTH=91 /DNA_ID=CAMNT_0007144245 /DNA_START=16 /DNA_END=291 /DNA_ORIENTATION=-